MFKDKTKIEAYRIKFYYSYIVHAYINPKL